MPIVNSVLSKARSARAKVARCRRNRSHAFGGFKKRTITTAQLLRLAWRSLVPELRTMDRVWRSRSIDPGFREELMLAVSRAEWLSLLQLGAPRVGPDQRRLERGTRRARATRSRRVRPAQVAGDLLRAGAGQGRLRASGAGTQARDAAQLHPDEIRKVEVVAKVMDIGNRGSNTFDAMLSRLRGVPEADRRVITRVAPAVVRADQTPVPRRASMT